MGEVNSLLDTTPTPEPAPAAEAPLGGDALPPVEPEVEEFTLPEFLQNAGLDEETSREKALLDFKSIGDLAKSYVSAKKFLGADKLKIPTDGSSDEEWRDVYTKLGLPENPEKYELKVKDETYLDKDFVTKFSEEAHKAGMLPKQAQAAIDFYQEQINASLQEAEIKNKEYLTTNEGLLKEEWGEAYSANMEKAKYAMKELGGDGFAEHMKETGALAHAKTLSFLAKVGHALSGDNMPGIKDGQTGPMTPEQAIMRMDDIRTEMFGITDITSPKYINLQKEQERMAKFAYPTQMGIAPSDEA